MLGGRICRKSILFVVIVDGFGMVLSVGFGVFPFLHLPWISVSQPHPKKILCGWKNNYIKFLGYSLL